MKIHIWRSRKTLLLCDWQRAWNIKRLAKGSLVSDKGSLTSTFFVRNRSRRKEKCLILSGHSEFIPFLFGWLVASGGFQATVPYEWSILAFVTIIWLILQLETNFSLCILCSKPYFKYLRYLRIKVGTFFSPANRRGELWD